MKNEYFPHQFETVFDNCVEAAEICWANIDSKSRDDGVIEASTNTTLLSWGEEIQIEVTRSTEHETMVSVDSNPKSQLFDWGKSEMNEQDFIEELSQLLE